MEESKTLERVGVRKFRDEATHYFSAAKPIAIERHGKLIGLYIPIKQKDPEEAKAAFARLNAAIERVLEDTGMTREEFEAYFDTDA